MCVCVYEKIYMCVWKKIDSCIWRLDNLRETIKKKKIKHTAIMPEIIITGNCNVKTVHFFFQ